MNIFRAEAILERVSPRSTKLHELYDDDDSIRDAVHTLFPDFEYPDFSHKTMKELLDLARKPHPAST